MKRIFSSLQKQVCALGALSIALSGVFGVMPARAEAVATVGADIQEDAALVGSLLRQVGSDAQSDLAALGNAFFEIFENIGLASLGGAKLMLRDMALFGSHAFDGVIAIGDSLAVASDSFFDGIESMGSGVAMAGNVFFDGANYVGGGLAFVGERVDNAIFAGTNFSVSYARVANRQETNTFPVSQKRELTVLPDATPMAPPAPLEPASVDPQAEPVSAVAGLKVVGSNLVLNDSDEADASEPADFSFYLGSGKANLANQNYAAAIADFEQAIRLSPSALNAYQQLAFTYQTQGNINSAIATIEIGLSQGGRSNADYLLQVGKLYFKRHTAEDLVVAERAFREVLALNPQSTEAIFALGAVAEAKDNAATP